MKTFNCIIIEDQVAAQRILKGYINDVPNLKLIGAFIDPSKALLAMTDISVDIMFLDIQLPKISGIDFLKNVSPKSNVILTTAFPEYAVEGFNLDVVDYLLKPFSFERFLKAVSKVSRVLSANEALVADKNIFIKANGILQKVKTEDILYVESKGDFSIVRTKMQGYIVNISLKEVVTTFGKTFLRCHKSYVINTNSIEKIIGNQIKSGQYAIPIGRTYKQHILQHIHLI